MSSNKIIFTNTGKKYPFLSNSYVSDLVIDGNTYFHVEGFYHSSRYATHDPATERRIRYVQFPQRIKKLIDEHYIDDEKNNTWNQKYRILTMKRGLLVKFTSDIKLAKSLLSTKDLELINGDTTDDYWGIGQDGKGKNMLGKLLMNVRDIVQDLSILDEQ